MVIASFMIYIKYRTKQRTKQIENSNHTGNPFRYVHGKEKHCSDGFDAITYRLFSYNLVLLRKIQRQHEYFATS